MPESTMLGTSIAAMFGPMYVGMVPLTSMTAVLAEERETGTLRCLRMANVSGIQYLLGIGICLFLESMFGIVVFAWLGKYTGTELQEYAAVSALGIVASQLLGATIGLIAKNQMAATSLSAPAAVLLSFLPMLSAMNEKIKRFSDLLYTQQLNI